MKEIDGRREGSPASSTAPLAGVAASAQQTAKSAEKRTDDIERPRALKGFVKNGVVHLLEGELPENCFVRVTVE